MHKNPVHSPPAKAHGLLAVMISPPVLQVTMDFVPSFLHPSNTDGWLNSCKQKDFPVNASLKARFFSGLHSEWKIELSDTTSDDISFNSASKFRLCMKHFFNNSPNTWYFSWPPIARKDTLHMSSGNSLGLYSAQSPNTMTWAVTCSYVPAQNFGADPQNSISMLHLHFLPPPWVSWSI